MSKFPGLLALPLYLALLSLGPAKAHAGFAPRPGAFPAPSDQVAAQPSSSPAPADNPGVPSKDAATKTASAANAPSPESVAAFRSTSNMMTWLIIVLVAVLIVSLIVFSFLGKWSLADALSEESSVQPNPQQVKMVASTSRLIALVGLMGILVVVLGIGYAIVWNIFTGGTLNFSLGDLSKFLFAAATMFAPYLANQFRSIFDNVPSGGTTAQPPAPGPAPAPAPAPPQAANQ